MSDAFLQQLAAQLARDPDFLQRLETAFAEGLQREAGGQRIYVPKRKRLPQPREPVKPNR